MSYLKCPAGHTLVENHLDGVQLLCDNCGKRVDSSHKSYGDRICDYDVCEECHADETGGVYHDAAGHALTPSKLGCRWRCDGCGTVAEGTVESYGCRDCDFDTCQSCVVKLKPQATVVAAAPASASTPVCCYWLQNLCNRGAQCQFAHEKNGQPCQYGPACRKGHYQMLTGGGGSSAPAASAATPSSSSVGKCSAGHPLKQEVMTCAFRCDDCGKLHNAGEMSYGCRIDDEDYCASCVKKMASPSAQAPPPASSSYGAPPSSQTGSSSSSSNVPAGFEDDGEGYIAQPLSGPAPPLSGSSAAGAASSYKPAPTAPNATGDLVVTCNAGHIMKKNEVHQMWRCDGCNTWSSNTGGTAYSDRSCNIDFCLTCAKKRAGASHTASSSSPAPAPPSTSPTTTTTTSSSSSSSSAPVVTCKSGHPLKEASMKGISWRCDSCQTLFDGGSSYGDRTCNWDVCRSCYNILAKKQHAHGHAAHTATTPQPPPHHVVAPTPAPVASHQQPRRCRALYIGINYPGTGAELSGCHNDVSVCLKFCKALGFDISNRRVLVDAPQNRFPAKSGNPTKKNIEEGMRWLADGARAGDCLWVSFSGHGTNTKPSGGGAFIQNLVPSDYQSAGLVPDTWIFDHLIRPLPRGCRLTCLWDCCHSGTMSNLKYRWRWNGEQKQFKPLPKIKKRDFSLEANMEDCDAEVIALSGCRDSQTSSDVSNVTSFDHDFAQLDPGAGKAGGACTNTLGEVFAAKSDHTGKINVSIMELLYYTQKRLTEKRFTQQPELTASYDFDLNKNFSLTETLRS